MKMQKIVASIATLTILLSGVLVSANAIYDKNAPNGESLNGTKEVRIMTTSVTGEKIGSETMSGSGMNNTSGIGMLKSKKGQARATKAKIKTKKAKEDFGNKAEKAEKTMNKYMEKFEKKSKQEKLNKYIALEANIDKIIEKFTNLDISEEKKEAYRNLFEYIRALNEEKIIELEEIEEETGTGTEVQ